MKIVNLTQFRELPENTVFMKYEPHIFGQLQIKMETWPHDFITDGPLDSLVNEFDEIGRSGGLLPGDDNIRWDDNQSVRDGLFEDDQWFAVFDNRDIEWLVGRLNKCLK